MCVRMSKLCSPLEIRFKSIEKSYRSNIKMYVILKIKHDAQNIRTKTRTKRPNILEASFIILYEPRSISQQWFAVWMDRVNAFFLIHYFKKPTSHSFKNFSLKNKDHIRLFVELDATLIWRLRRVWTLLRLKYSRFFINGVTTFSLIYCIHR